jgi:hypothetical protein
LYRFIFNLFRITHIETAYFTIDISKFQWLSLNNSENKNNLKLFWFAGYYINPKTKEEDVFTVNINIEKHKYNIDYLKRVCNFISNEAISNFVLEMYDCNEVISDKNIIERYAFYKDEYFVFSPYLDEFKPQYDKFFEGVRLKE